jgi:hypothetical protein
MQAWSSGVIEKADVLKTLGHSRIGNTYCIYICTDFQHENNVHIQHMFSKIFHGLLRDWANIFAWRCGVHKHIDTILE